MIGQNRFKRVDRAAIIFLAVVIVCHFGNGLANAAAVGKLFVDFLVFEECAFVKVSSTGLRSGFRHLLVALSDAELGLTTQLTLLNPCQPCIDADRSP